MGKLEICAVQPHLLIQNDLLRSKRVLERDFEKCFFFYIVDDLILSKEKVQENSVVGKVAMTIRNI